MSINEIFFELIRVAIGTQDTLSRPPSKVEWAELYAMSKKQSLVGICFSAVQKLTQNQEPITHNLDEVQYLTWMGMAAKIQRKNEQVNRQCVELQQMVEKAGFRSYIMKGQGNAALYRKASPEPSPKGKGETSASDDIAEAYSLSQLRQSGDIDIYLDGGFEKVNDFVQRTCPTTEINELEIHYHCFSDPSTSSGEPTEVEIHYRPCIMRNPFKNRKLQRFFAEEGEKCYENMISLPNGAGEITVPTIEFNLVHQMVHIHLHLFTEGIGMRQMMDYYFVLRTMDDNTSTGSARAKNDNENVLRIVHELGLDRFASALMWVLGYVFGLEESLILWVPNEEDGRFLLNEVVLSGNFGHDDEVLNRKKQRKGYRVWALFFKNIRLARFDHGDWFWGPIWRITHKITKNI